MDLLPKSREEFRAQKYWESFFKNRKDAFEWYGEYADLCGALHKYCKTNDKILVTGCGNSRISEDLYDVGYHDITNIDIAEIVIKQMNDRNSKHRENMKFLKMDVLEMQFDNDSFSVVLDKGTLDAIFTEKSELIVKDVHKMFSEIHRVLKPGGRYICITLVQEHILDELLAYFPSNWFMRIHRAEKQEDDDSGSSGLGGKLPVFIFVMTKMKIALPKPILELSLNASGKMTKVEDIGSVKKAIQDIQNYAILQNKLERSNLEDDIISVQLWSANSSEEPRYSLAVVDTPKDAWNGCQYNGKYAVFIVQQGRELDWLFSSDKGRKKLALMAGFDRLAIATLHRGHTYKSIEEVKSELSARVMDLAPSSLGSKQKVPFLTVGDDVGYREIIFEKGVGSLNGCVVEDVKLEDNCMYRRLIFKKNPLAVQSTARIVIETKSKGKKKGMKKSKAIDQSYLCAKYHQAMLTGFTFINGFTCAGKLNVLLIGLGGGGFPSFLVKAFPKISVTCIDLDHEVIDIATKWFGFKESERLKAIEADGIKFIESKTNEGMKHCYHMVIFDVNAEDETKGITGPPPVFLEASVLENVSNLLYPDGVFVVNLLSRDDEIRVSALKDIQKKFPNVFHCKSDEEEVNLIVFGLSPQRTAPIPSQDERLKLGNQIVASVRTIRPKSPDDTEMDYLDLQTMERSTEKL